MDGGVKIGHGHRVFLDFFAELVVGDAVGAHVIESSTGEDQTESRSLMTPSAPVVELGGTPELGADCHQCLIEQALLFQIANQRGQGGVEFLNQNVLIELSLEMSIPTRAVDEIEVVRKPR